MVEKTDAELAAQLTSWYSETELGKQVFDWACRTKKAEGETKIETLQNEIGLSRADAVLAAKALSEEGFGAFIAGRHKKPSRIKWHFTLASIGRVAAGRAKKLE